MRSEEKINADKEEIQKEKKRKDKTDDGNGNVDNEEEDDDGDGNSDSCDDALSTLQRYHELSKQWSSFERNILLRPIWIAFHTLAEDLCTFSLTNFQRLKKRVAEIVHAAEQETQDSLSHRQFRDVFLKWLSLTSFKSDMKYLVWDKRTRTIFHTTNFQSDFRTFLLPYSGSHEQIADLTRLHSESHHNSDMDLKSASSWMHRNHWPYSKEWIKKEWDLIMNNCEFCNRYEKKEENVSASSSLSLQQRLALSASPPVNKR